MVDYAIFFRILWYLQFPSIMVIKMLTISRPEIHLATLTTTESSKSSKMHLFMSHNQEYKKTYDHMSHNQEYKKSDCKI